jgi:hypothetical protein
VYQAIATDASENAYLIANTSSTTFPVTPGAFQKTLAGGPDGIAIKLNSTGSKLLYATYLGGTGTEFPIAITVSPSGKATIAGLTNSNDFPVSKDALEPEPAGAARGFLIQLNSSGTGSITSTYLNGDVNLLVPFTGGSTLAMTQDQFGSVYVAGHGDMGPTLGAFQTTTVDHFDGFVTKIEPLCALSTTNRIVRICTPANEATVSSPVRIIAGSTDDVHVQLMEVFVDGAKAYERVGETSVYVRLPIAAGRHRVTVEAVDLNNTHFWKTVNLNVK